MSEPAILSLQIPDELVAALVARVREELRAEKPGGDIDATAEHFGVPVRTIRDWRERGCPAKRIGKRLWFDWGEVREWIGSQP